MSVPEGLDERSSWDHIQQTRGAPQLDPSIPHAPSGEGSPGFQRHTRAPPHRTAPTAPHRSWANARRSITAATALREGSMPGVTITGEHAPR